MKDLYLVCTYKWKQKCWDANTPISVFTTPSDSLVVVTNPVEIINFSFFAMLHAVANSGIMKCGEMKREIFDVQTQSPLTFQNDF